MRKIYEPQAVADCIERSQHRSILKTLPPELFLLQYEKGELVTAPFVKEQWFQTVISGSLNIYFIRDDGGLYSLSDGNAGYILGDMELFNPNISSVYTEAAEPLLCLALSIDKNRAALLDNNDFLRLMCQSLTAKMEAITALEAAPCSLHDRVLYYMLSLIHIYAQMSALQLSALQSRMDAVKATENMIRTERHDLRHRLQIAAELVTQGDKTAALDFLNAAQKKLDDHKEIHWCRQPVLDAVFTSYFDQAQRQEIRIEANLSLSSVLPVDESELAIVLANALENAIYANMKLPSGRREICCHMVSVPSLMLEISNPCDEIVTFDDQGSGSPAARTWHGYAVHLQFLSQVWSCVPV